jgi:uncharacterized cupredoxin-like copper-binding protein
VLAAVSTEHKIGMLVVAGIFIAFALASSFVFPRYWPQFPGSRGLGAFIVGSLALFVAMLLAVEFFAVEEEEAHAGDEPAAVEEQPAEPTTTTETTETTEAPPTTETAESPPTSGGPETQTVDVSGTEFAFELSTDEVGPGVVIFRLRNDGQLGHDLAIEGPGVEEAAGGEPKTPVIDPGQTADLEIRLAEGTYDLICTVPGHRDAGMEVELEVA